MKLFLLVLFTFLHYTVAKIVDLTEENFEELTVNKRIVVMAYTGWCGACQKIAPVWEELSFDFANPDVTVARLNCEKQNEICRSLNVDSFPSILYSGGFGFKKYKGERTLVDIIEFLDNNLKETCFNNEKKCKKSQLIKIKEYDDKSTERLMKLVKDAKWERKNAKAKHREHLRYLKDLLKEYEEQKDDVFKETKEAIHFGQYILSSRGVKVNL